MEKQRLIKLIHIAKSKLNIDEMSYRLMLERLTKKNSSKDMTIPELHIVLTELQKKGFKVTTKKQLPTRTNIAKKIKVVWSQMAKEGIVRDGSLEALNSFARNVVNPILRKQGRVEILNVAALDNYYATLVLERLKKWQERGKNNGK